MAVSKEMSYSECMNMLKTKLTDTFYRSLEVSIQTFKYEGFDVQLIFKTFLGLAAAAERNEEQLATDVVQLVALFHYRGNNIKGITKENTGEAGHKTIQTLLERYHVRSNGKGQTITLSRISQIFPIVSEFVFTKVYKSLSLPVTALEVGIPDTEPLFPNYVPLFLDKGKKEGANAIYLTLHNIYQTFLSYKVQRVQKIDSNGKVTTMNKEPLGAFYSQAVRYSQLTMAGSSLSDSEKSEVVRSWPPLTTNLYNALTATLQKILDSGFTGDNEVHNTINHVMRYCALTKTAITTIEIKDLTTANLSKYKF